MASESVALKQLGFKNIRDIKPGEAVIIESFKEGKESARFPIYHQVVKPSSYTPDFFEYVYFSRPETIMDGISVYRSRQNMGAELAKQLRKALGDKVVDGIDVGAL